MDVVDSNEEDDPVIQTIPMIINHEMGHNLYYMKSSIHPLYRKPYELKGARIRPVHNILETQRGPQGKIKYQSLKMSKEYTNLVMGCIKKSKNGKVFTCTSVGHILRMSPKLEDDEEENNNNDEVLPAAVAVKEEVSIKSENDSEPVPVTVDVKAQRHPRAMFANRTRRKNYQEMQKKVKQDEWVDLKVHDVGSVEGFNAIQRLSHEGSSSSIFDKNYDLSAQEYRKRMSGMQKKGDEEKKKKSSKSNLSDDEDEEEKMSNVRDSTLKALVPAPDSNEHFFRKYRLQRQHMDSSMNANDRIRVVLQTARVCSFSEIAEYVREGNGDVSSKLSLSDMDILNLLDAHEYATCVRGVWVLSSRFAIQVDESLHHEAISHRTSAAAIKKYEILCRDCILANFQESPTFRVCERE